MMWSTLLPLALAALSTTTYAYANPGACSGVCTNTHDPSIVRRSDGTYFRFSTGGLVSIHSAPSISGPWAFKCNMLSGNAKVTTSGNPGTDVWAPDVSLVGNTYYVFYSVSTFGTQESGIGVATSPDLSCGSFTDHGATGVKSINGKQYNAIDAQLFNDGGTYRLNFGSFWSNLFQVTMANPPKQASGSSVQIAFDPAGVHSEEATYMIKNGGYYYMFFSWGQCCGYDKNMPVSGAEYQIKVCRSTSPSSGFVDASGTSCLYGGGTTVLKSHGNVFGPGGQSVYNDPKNGWVLVYHYVDKTIGYGDGDKKFGWNKIIWNNGWPTV